MIVGQKFGAVKLVDVVHALPQPFGAAGVDRLKRDVGRCAVILDGLAEVVRLEDI